MTNKRITQVDPVYNLHEYGCNIQSREIYLHGNYTTDDEEVGVEFRMANTFMKNLHLLERQNATNILVHMHTIGGNWNDGIAIYDNVLLSAAPITILAHAHARSMSSIILQAADLRVLMPDTDFMIHHGTMSEEGVVPAVMSSVEYTKKLTNRMLGIYAAKCINGHYFQSQKTITVQKVVNFLSKQIDKKSDWWMTAEEAVDFGFADGISGRDYNWEEMRE